MKIKIRPQGLIEDLRPSNDNRNISRHRVLNMFIDNCQLSPELAKDIELKVYNYAKSTSVDSGDQTYVSAGDLYMDKIYHLYNNLLPGNSNGNNYLRAEVLSGRITTDQLPVLSPSETFPQRWKRMNDKSDYTARQNLGMSIEGVSDLFQCPKCYKSSCKYFERQVRCSDEPMTIFITCVNCGHRWTE